jgi:hypothetical protein
VGDVVNYTITLINTNNTPGLTCTATDPLLGGVIWGPGELPPGNTVLTPTYTVQAGDPNPLENTVTLHCDLPAGLSNDLADVSDSHSVILIQPVIDVTKTGDTLSKVGDVVNYTITLINTNDTPGLTCTATDPLLGGVIWGPDELPPGNTVLNPTYTVPVGAPDGLTNTVTLHCELPDGFSNELQDVSDSHSVNLFYPKIVVTKTGDDNSKVGDALNHSVTILNDSSADTPGLSLISFVDTLVPGVTPPSECDDLDPGESCTIDYSYTVQAGDPDSLVNTATAVYEVDGFGNQKSDSGSWTANLLHPSFTVAKSCTNEPVPQSGPATWDIVVTNTGDVVLDVVLTDGATGGNINVDDLGVAEARTVPVSLPGPFAGQATVSNTVNATATLAIPGVYTNVITPQEDSATCVVAGEVNLTKYTQGVLNDEGEIIPSPGLQTWTFTLFGPGLPAGGVIDTSPPSEVDFGGVSLIPIESDDTAVYRLCEGPINAGWTLAWYGDPNDTGTADMPIPFQPMVNDDPVPDPKEDPPGYSNVFDPNYVDPPDTFINDTRCVNFVANAGETEAFKIDNQFPGGEPRTIGYWKNWNSCTGGGQVDNAAEAGDTPQERIAAAKALLDDALQDPGITIGTLNLIANDDIYECDDGTQDAVNILDKRTINGRKRSSDGAYALASQLLAAIANVTVGAGSCQARDTAVMQAQILLTRIGFDGTGEYLTPKKVKNDEDLQALRTEALDLSWILDSYNNGTLCAVPVP